MTFATLFIRRYPATATDAEMEVSRTASERIISLDDFAGHLGFGTNHHRHHILDQRQQLLFRMALGQNHDFELRPLLEQSYAFRRNRVTNQNFHKEPGV